MATSKPSSFLTWMTGPTGAYGINKKRIYRTVTGASGVTTYRLLEEIPVATTTATDTSPDADLGEALLSTLWDPPPEDLEGLIGLPNGIMAGFVGRDIFFSEPYQPHAWPRDYVQVSAYDIVGLASFGTTIVVGTKGRPYLITGAHPATIVMVEQELRQPCIAKRSFAHVGQQGVVYASPNGIVLVGPGGAELISRDAYDLRAWRALGPENIQAFYHDNQLLLFLEESAIAFDAETGTVTEYPDDEISGGYLDEEADRLYVTTSDGIQEWRSSVEAAAGGLSADTARTYVWESGIDEGPSRTYSAVQVIANSYPVMFRLFGKSGSGSNAVERVFEKEVGSRAAFRVPTKVTDDQGVEHNFGLHSEWRYELEGTVEVEEVRIGAMQEMLGS